MKRAISRLFEPIVRSWSSRVRKNRERIRQLDVCIEAMKDARSKLETAFERGTFRSEEDVKLASRVHFNFTGMIAHAEATRSMLRAYDVLLKGPDVRREEIEGHFDAVNRTFDTAFTSFRTKVGELCVRK